MKRVIFTLLATTCIASAVEAQITYPNFHLNWYSKAVPVTKPVKSITDSLYRTLTPGATIKMSLLSDEEKKKPELERALLSYGRAEELMNYFRAQRIPQKDFEVEMVPFHQPNRLRSSEITSRGYRNFMSRKSESFFMIHKSVAHALSTAQLKFDESTKRERETFAFTASVDNKIILASGTEFTIPANTFITKSGKPVKEAEIQANISEYKKTDKLVLKGMTTTCGGRMLQSNGMWHIAFSAQGEELQVAPGKNYGIKVGMEGKEAKMQVFTGEIKNGIIDWKLQSDGEVKAIKSSTNPVQNEILAIESEEVPVINNLNVNQWNQNWNNNTDNYELNRNIKTRTPEEIAAYNRQANNTQGVTNHQLYELKLNDVGWINCDAFYEVEEKTEIVVQCDTTKGLNAMLVFTKRKSVLPAYACAEPGVVKFTNIPVGEQALLVIFKKSTSGSFIKYTKLVNPGNDKTILAALKPSSEEKLSAEINGILAD